MSLHDPAEKTKPTQVIQSRDTEIVRRFRILPEEERTHQVLIVETHSAACWQAMTDFQEPFLSARRRNDLPTFLRFDALATHFGVDSSVPSQNVAVFPQPMPTTNQKLEWCVVRPGADLNWWVREISDPVHWDVDGLGIIDPRQLSYILEQCESLREYGFDPDIIEQAFFPFSIEGEEEKGSVRLVRSKESILEDSGTLFVLPDLMDEEKGPYADFLDAITRARVRMVNDLIEFDQNLTVDDLEEDIRERQNQDFMEGKAVHSFAEIISILDYVPDGYELEEDDRPKSDDEDLEDIPDFEDEEPDEKIEEDETMKWDEDDEEEEDDFDENERPDDFDEAPEEEEDDRK
jgi:hypothetical protein